MASRHQSLRTGLPLWRAIDAPAYFACSLENDLHCEVAIIGGGITGSLVGYMLARTGVDAVILDRDDLGIASTAASTGLLQYEIDTPLHQLIAKVGETQARHAYRRGMRAIDEIEALVGELGVDCGFRHRQTLCLASTQADLISLKTEWECRRQCDFEVQWLESSDLRTLSGFCSPAAMLSTGGAEIDPYLFTQALLCSASKQGIRAFAKSAIARMEESPHGVTLYSDAGLRIQARSAVLCTGYLAYELLPHAPGDLNTTYVAAALHAPQRSLWPEGFLVWETARPYFYCRQTSEGHILIGGGDTAGPFDHRDVGLLQMKALELQQRFCELYPQAEFQPDLIWAGTFAETSDGMPYIGKAPKSDRIYAALGYGGNGITFGMIAARMICDLYAGRSTPDEQVFRFGR